MLLASCEVMRREAVIGFWKTYHKCISNKKAMKKGKREEIEIDRQRGRKQSERGKREEEGEGKQEG